MAMTGEVSGLGHDSPLCGAAKRQGAGNCRRPAGWGTSHPGAGTCKLHGGSTRNHTRAVAYAAAEAEFAAFKAAWAVAVREWAETPLEERQPWLGEDYWRDLFPAAEGGTGHGDARPR